MLLRQYLLLQGTSKVSARTKYLWRCDPVPSPYSSVMRDHVGTPITSRDHPEFPGVDETCSTVSKMNREQLSTHALIFLFLFLFSFFLLSPLRVGLVALRVHPTLNLLCVCVCVLLHPPLAAAVKPQAGPMMNVAARECKRRHLKSERAGLNEWKNNDRAF